MNVLVVLWRIGEELTSNPSTIPGHTALPLTTTYQEVVVDSTENLKQVYQCNDIEFILDSNLFMPEVEGKCSCNVTYWCNPNTRRILFHL